MRRKIRLKDRGTLFLTMGEAWRDEYLDLVLPLLSGRAPAGAELVPSSRGTEVWRTAFLGSVFYLKFFHSRGFRDIVRLRNSRSLRAAKGGEILRRHGFQPPVLVAQGDLVKGLRRTANFLMVCEIEGGVNLYDYISEQFRDTSAEGLRRKRRLLRELGALVGRLHRKRVVHGDLRPGNVIVRHSGEDPEVYFLDNERNSCFNGDLPMRLRKKNLVQINMIITPFVTRTDRLRFFDAYLKENPELSPVAKKLGREVCLTTRGRLREKRAGQGVAE